MRQAFEIGRKDLRILSLSPIGWLVLIILLVQGGSMLVNNLTHRSTWIWNMGEFTPSVTFNMLFGYSNSLITGIFIQLYIYIPLLTMGLMSKEQSDGTIRLLFSSPVKTSDIVVGKFLSILGIAVLITGLTALYGLLLHVFVIEQMDTGLLCGGLVMLFLIICLYGAIGLFISSLTSYQFVAAMGSVCVFLLLEYAGNLNTSQLPVLVSEALVWLQGFSFLYYFKGYLGSWEIVYLILLTVLFLALTYVRLQSQRESVTGFVRFRRYVIVLITGALIAYISSLPAFKYYWDLRQADLSDAQLKINKSSLPAWRMWMMQIIPMIFITIGLYVLWRRRTR